MQKWSRVLLASLGCFVGGCASCVPGVRGCALSLFPSSWEEFITYPALALDLCGVLGIATSLIAMLVILLRRSAT